MSDQPADSSCADIARAIRSLAEELASIRQVHIQQFAALKAEVTTLRSSIVRQGEDRSGIALSLSNLEAKVEALQTSEQGVSREP